MVVNRFILILFAYGLLCACATKPATDNREPLLVKEQQESNIDEVKQLELEAFLNEHGTISLHIKNNSVVNVDNILVGLRLRYSARIVTNTTFAVPQGVQAGQSLVVDTEIAVPIERSIIRAQVIEAKFAP